MPDMDDFYAYKSTSEGSGGGSGGRWDFGCGWIVIIIVVFLLLFFIADGASWDAIESLLGLGMIAFVVAKSLFR